MKIKVGISKRHMHLTKEVFEELFGNVDMEVRNYLNQPGEYASSHTVDLKWNDKVLERVRVVGPCRKYNQIEITREDASFLGVNPPVRKSGDVENSHPITLVAGDKEVNLDKGLLVAERHIHMGAEDALKFNVVDGEKVLVFKDGQEIYDAQIKITDPSYLELHIDIDEAMKYNISQNDEVEIRKI